MSWVTPNYSFLSRCLLRFSQVTCIKQFDVLVVHWHIWSFWCCSLMSVALFFCFFFRQTAWVCCRFHCCGADRASLFCVNFTTPFLFPEQHTVWHPPTCSISSFLLAAPLLTCRVQFGSHSPHFLLSVAPGHFTGDASTTGFSFFFCLNFWPFRPSKLSFVVYSLVSAKINFFCFLWTNFSHSLKFLLRTNTSVRYADECSQPSRLERTSWLKKFNCMHSTPWKSSFF